MDKAALALAVGVLIAGVVQLGFQLPFLWRERVLPHPRLGRDEGVSRVLKLMVPAIFASSVTQINLLVNTALASNLPTGSISWLFYSDRIMEFPLGVFGIALATVLLPALSKLHARGAGEQFAKVMDWSLRWVVIIVVPAALRLILLAGPIVATLFLHGVTTPDDVRMIARSLIAFSFGLMGFVLIKVLVPGFFARQDTRTPVRAAVVGVFVNLLLGVLLFTPLGHVGLAIALSVAAWVQAGALFYMLRQRGILRIQAGWIRLARQVGIAVVAMAILLWWGTPALNDWMNAEIGQRILWLTGWVLAGVGVYFLVILAQGVRPKDLILRQDVFE